MINQDRNRPSNQGTLLWVGPRKSAEFLDAYQFCEQNASQIAIRCNLEDVGFRPADHVAGIVLTHDDRSPIDVSGIELLCTTYECENVILLLGSLFAGDRSQTRINFPHASWSHWKEVVPELLRQCGYRPRDNFLRAKSVAVVANSLSIADPLLDLASECEVTAVWCRHGHTARARNFDIVWWDDSVAKPVPAKQWAKRIEGFSNTALSKQTHYWLANGVQKHRIAEATAGGIKDVFAKPLNIDSLIQTIEEFGQTETVAQQQPLRRAA